MATPAKKPLIIVESPTKAKTISRFMKSRYQVMASLGHVRDLPKSTLGIDVENDFAPKYINIRGKGDTIKKLKDAAKKASVVYLATDPDREGEAISWHLCHILGIEPEEAKRVAFHEITEKAVKEAFAHPKPLNMRLVDAQQARRLLDRLVGYSLSPLLWHKIRPGLSAGRVQSAALRLIAERQREIDAFVPQEYWTIDAYLEGAQGEVKAKYSGSTG
jgi:DNA topoisomerase-1